ncbi:Pentatricopeptide repeat-containing protein [Platanthera zijinensis]|uniref:Pentatricopeptide repeat-containing protein n=1 Tax=Platanthera zijinensis TaxID=2320716 RepID=A0AAP0GDK6_9ASPA
MHVEDAVQKGAYFILKKIMQSVAILPTALVDMYCRCGCVEAALEVFRRVSSKDVVLWNVMIGGLAMHGHSRLAVDLFALMKETATAPNESTYIAAMFAQTVHIVLVCTKPKMVCT